MKGFQDLFLQLMFEHFLFGMNYGLPNLGFGQYCSDSVILPDILHFKKLLLITRSSIMLRLIVKLFHYKVPTFFKRCLKLRLIRHVCSPVLLSVSPRSCYFERFADIKCGTQTINAIEIFPGKQNKNVFILKVKTLSKSAFTFKSSMCYEDVIHFDVKTKKGDFLLRHGHDKIDFPICAKQGEYSARAGDDLVNNSIIFLNFRGISRMILAHFSKVTAIAIHPFLRILVTCDSYVKHAKVWYIPSELSSDPVLISILHTHDLIVSSVGFHPELPFVIFGGTNGTIQVWRAK